MTKQQLTMKMYQCIQHSQIVTQLHIALRDIFSAVESTQDTGVRGQRKCFSLAPGKPEHLRRNAFAESRQTAVQIRLLTPHIEHLVHPLGKAPESSRSRLFKQTSAYSWTIPSFSTSLSITPPMWISPVTLRDTSLCRSVTYIFSSHVPSA